MPVLIKSRITALMFAALYLALSLSSASAAPPVIDGCQVFPTDNPWNTDISDTTLYPVHPNSANYINNINANGGDFLHPDFGEDPTYGIPWITVSGTQAKLPVSFEYADESDPGPYPIPSNPPIEGGAGSSGDRHILIIDTDNCVLYETYSSYYVNGSWEAGSGAIFNLDSNALRPEDWTSADAAGLPIFPGLARCEEANTGAITHALRFTVNETQRAYIYPARHFASPNTGTNYPPMGLRLRLNAGYDLSSFSGQALAVAQALKTYGMILADNGSNWFVSGETNPTCWDDDNLNRLKTIPGSAFEVIVSPPPAPVTLNPPTLSTPVDAEAVNSTQPPLIWNTITSAAYYEVQFGENNPPPIVGTVDSTAFTQYIPPAPLAYAQTYYWRVRAFDNDGNLTDWSPLRSFIVASPAGAAPARNLFVVTTPTLTWNRVSWAAGYDVQIGTNATFTGATIYPAGNALSFTTPALTSGTYYWRVCAKPTSGSCGLWSAPDTFMVDV